MMSSTSILRKSELLLKKRQAISNSEGQVFSIWYNGLPSPWFVRRNEVAIQVLMQGGTAELPIYSPGFLLAYKNPKFTPV